MVFLTDSIRVAFGQVCFELKYKNNPFISHAITTDSIQTENTCCFKISLIQIENFACLLYSF
jgi:hypothetical protein